MLELDNSFPDTFRKGHKQTYIITGSAGTKHGITNIFKK